MTRKIPRVLAAAVAVALGALAGEVPPAAEPSVFPVEPGAPKVRVLGPGETHVYTMALKKGQFVKLSAMQQGVDLVLTVFDPAGKKLAEVDSPNGANGPEPYSGEAEMTGVYRFEVKDLDPAAPPGNYEIRVTALLSPEDYARHKIVDLPADRYENYRGNFELSPGRVLMVAPIGPAYTANGKEGLLVMDTASLRVGPLYASSPTDFFLGPNLSEPYPPQDEIRFSLSENGRAVSATWIPQGGGPTLTGKRVDPFIFERVSIQNGPVTLKGWVMIPAGKGPFPAVVHAHGSQGCTADVGQLGNFFVRQGVAFLSFDKRGAGESTGNWQTSSLEELAGDQLAGVAYLRGRKDIDAARVGIWGISQGGWVASLAAAKSSDVKFIIVHSGSGVSVADNMVHENCSQMRDAGLPEASVQEGAAFLKRILHMMSDGAGYEEVVAAGKPSEGKPWAPYCSLHKLPRENYLWNWMRLNGNYDPATILKNVHCPVLWFLGDKDSQVPTAESAPRLREALKAGKNPDATVKVIPNANHGLFLCSTALPSEVYQARQYATGYWDAMAEWLHGRVTNASR